METYQLQLIGWATQAQRALVDYAKCFGAVAADQNRLTDQVEFAVGQLQFRAASTSDSALFLIGHLKLWDAEILVRTVAEASLKLTYICVGERVEQEERTDEFLRMLPDLTRMKRHTRAQDLLGRLPQTASGQWRPISDVLIPSEELDALKARYPKERQKSVENRWGFIRIGETLGRSGTEFKELAGLAYLYGMGSHSVHQDGDAILMMWERDQREENRREAIERAHAAREISDILAFAFLRARAAYKAVDLDLAPVIEVAARYRSLEDEMHEAYQAFHALEYPESTNRTESRRSFEGLDPEGHPFIRRSSK